jgi:hypothetical protein
MNPELAKKKRTEISRRNYWNYCGENQQHQQQQQQPNLLDDVLNNDTDEEDAFQAKAPESRD